MSQTVIKVENLYKEYQLGTIGYGSFRHDLQAWWAKVRKKEDPNAQIGKNKHKDLNETFLALNDVSFEIKEGEAVGIIGKNGAGKSTLLKILSRTTAPSKGQIKIKGKIASLLEVGTGFHPELTGRENVFLNGAILGMKKREISRKFDEIVAFSGIEKFIDTPVKRYSSGMYVRLAFAVAAHLDSDILILDEVLAVGDAEFQKKCLGKMDYVAKNQGRTVLFVSHNMAAVKKLCHKAILLEKGTLTSTGDSDLIIENYLKNFQDSANTQERYFEIDKNKDFQLTNIKVIDNKQQIKSIFSCDEEITLLLSCKKNIEIKDLLCYLTISKSDETMIYQGDSCDALNNPFNIIPIGESKISIRIPPRLLGHGDYLVYLNFTSSLSISSFNLDSPGYVCSFHIEDVSSKRGNHREGYLSTLLEWNIEK